MKIKKLLMTTIAIFGLALISNAQVPNYVPSNGLIGWWPFNGNANDESGNGNNGTVNGASLTSDRFGNSQSAYNYDGVSSNIIANISPEINIQIDTLITFSYWVNLNVIGPTFPQATVILTQNNFTSAISSWYDNSILKIVGNNSISGASYNNVWSNNENQVSVWYNYVLKVNTISNRIDFYENGQLQGFSDVNNLVLSNLNKLALGYYPLYGNVWFLNGKLDDIGIWNRALTQQEITSLYQSCNLGTSINPVISNINTSSNAVFNATTNDPNATYQWQTNGVNLGWQNVPINSNYTGATSNSLTINNVQLANHLQPFRVIATSGSCIDTSNIATINITDTCIVTINDTITTLISVTDTLIINATVTGLTPPNNLNTIKVFPNPANDHITINYGNFASMSGYTLKITNNLGQVVFTSPINQQSSYIDLSTWSGNGIYFVQIIDPQNNTIENRKIVIQ